jgi:hemerythrin-like domain-containing protein
MEHDPIKTMLDEHEVISKAEEIINNSKDLWLTNETNYIALATELVSFFRSYADEYHHRKEEDVLFPAIKDHPDFILDELIDEFEQHHEDFRDYTGEIETALAAKDYPKSYDTLQEYVNDLLDHIGAENDELFVLAESLLDEDELETIYFKFKDIDLELGEERKRKFEQRIEALAD